MKNRNKRYFTLSMMLTLCICLLGGIFMTTDYNNKFMSGQSSAIGAQSFLNEKIPDSIDKYLDNPKIEGFIERASNFLTPAEKLTAVAAKYITDILNETINDLKTQVLE